MDKIPLGEDFRHVLDTEIRGSHLVLVVIGRGWLEDPRPRADGDFVRTEIEIALQYFKREPESRQPTATLIDEIARTVVTPTAKPSAAPRWHCPPRSFATGSRTAAQALP